MGNVVPTGRAGEEPQQLVASIDDSRLLFQDELWNGKFLKSARCQSSGNVLVVKVYEKIPATDPQLLRKLRKQLEDLREQVRPATHPNVLAYTRWGETSRVAYVMRQFTSSNLHDRQNTRPFLAPMEKRWIVYQMLKALSQCHGSGIVHGDIKAENFLVTSHTWVLLADFAPYKPTFLPLDDTAPYNYFFDSSNKRDCCCVAPERFRSPTSIIDISLLDSAPPQCASVLSVMMDPGVPDVDAEFELAEASASLEAEDRAAAAKRDGLAEGGDSGSAGASREASMGGGGSKVLRKSGNSGPKSLACFNLSEVLRYANPELGADARATLLQSKLDKVTDPLIRPLVESMLQADPSQRKSADVYLQEFTGPNKAFPSYFADVLHPFFRELLQEEYDSPDERIWAVCRRYEELVSALCNIHDKRGAAYFAQQSAAWAARHAALDVSLKDSPMRSVQDDLDGDGGAGSERSRGSTGGGGEESTRASRGDNEAVRDLLARTQKIMAQLADLNVSDKMRAAVTSASENVSLQYDALSKQYSAAPPPPPLDFTGSLSGGGEDFFLAGGPGARGVEATSDSYAASPSALNIPAGENGVLIVIHMLAATIRFVRFPSTKVAALCALLRLSRFSNDETRLQRVLPYVVHELCESSSREFSSLVRCTALRALTDLVRKIKRLPASDRRIFPEYIFPALARFKMDPSLNARLTFAECLPRLAEASGRFLDLARLHADLSNSDAADCHTGRDSSSSIRGKGKSGDDALAKPVTFDAQLNELHDIVQDFVSNMIEQPAVVRRTLLCDITRLCLFFGRERTSSHVLPILITCLSERNDWQLRATFFEHIPGVSALVGPLALQQFLLPCIVQSLYEFEELVVERTLTCVYSLTQLGLLDVTMMSELAAKVGPLVYHPSVWIRNAVVRVLAALVASKRMGLVETQVTIVRLIEPYLKKSEARNALLLGCSKNVEENEALLREMLVDRLPRDVYEAAAERDTKQTATWHTFFSDVVFTINFGVGVVQLDYHKYCGSNPVEVRVE
ncbi:Phosphoinositide 3-kinase regulatory subunit 4 [Hondaea fermentalgiana]|uniref:Phosphoinositide 3-kinase regulatory subunit 4 n=1 Tax=Hondaea fermentalgiana TaxID=2315210 RepID=A0A2R5GMB9_9STRA|nr:Phosphoinositide 3-kinase regulatory subunit 4 [Hondaea fermentalgiana]|eukprot:GBG32042.1 Phosphoinositide 3-kinase regulatory subunit 4 [Hondaea fermentalgiana]